MQTAYEARIPNCDAASAEEDYCYGDHVDWNWEGGAAFSQEVAIWAMGEDDRLACLSGSHRLLAPLHIAIDALDPTGSEDGRMGLWRARNGEARYAYICEGSPSVQNSSFGGRLSRSVR